MRANERTRLRQPAFAQAYGGSRGSGGQVRTPKFFACSRRDVGVEQCVFFSWQSYGRGGGVGRGLGVSPGLGVGEGLGVEVGVAVAVAVAVVVGVAVGV